MKVNIDQYQEILSDHIEKGLNPILKIKHLRGEMRRFFLQYMDFIFLYTENVNLEIKEEGNDLVYEVSPALNQINLDGRIDFANCLKNSRGINPESPQS